MSNVDLVRAAFGAYLTQDRAAMDRLLAEDFVFTSPQDDHIGKAAFLDVCFPTADRLRSQEILDAVAPSTASRSSSATSTSCRRASGIATSR
ncbi:DUF4440 domain-containing protein [Streptomyces sp. NPDC048516]|uniref:DUF4440 domain-containing protein n=1 Tax=Streptomyces sp. NPDC048516 TaxID=3365565 RepID=UPI00371D5F23